MHTSIKTLAAGAVLMLGMTVGATSAQAQCVGVCGTLGADGDVVASPLGGTYDYVTTDGGVTGGGSLGIVGTTNGSQNTTASFAALAGSTLSFFFNYVTSDGAGFSDYAFSQLQTPGGVAVATLFSARTVVVGNTVPGFGLPPLLATLTPASTPILPGSGEDGGPFWSPLGTSSGGCFDVGCGLTGWIKADYTIPVAGTYRLVFGVANFDDVAFDSGLAYDGVVIDGTPVEPGVPEPATWAMLIIGFGLVGSAMRSRRILTA